MELVCRRNSYNNVITISSYGHSEIKFLSACLQTRAQTEWALRSKNLIPSFILLSLIEGTKYGPTFLLIVHPRHTISYTTTAFPGQIPHREDLNSFHEWYQNIFPWANSFAKGKMLGDGSHPTRPQWRVLVHFWVTFGLVIKYPQLEHMRN